MHRVNRRKSPWERVHRCFVCFRGSEVTAAVYNVALCKGELISQPKIVRVDVNSDVNKDWTPKDEDKDKDLTIKDKDKDKDKDNDLPR